MLDCSFDGYMLLVEEHSMVKQLIIAYSTMKALSKPMGMHFVGM